MIKKIIFWIWISVANNPGVLRWCCLRHFSQYFVQWHTLRRKEGLVSQYHCYSDELTSPAEMLNFLSPVASFYVEIPIWTLRFETQSGISVPNLIWEMKHLLWCAYTLLRMFFMCPWKLDFLSKHIHWLDGRYDCIYYDKIEITWG